MNTPRTVADIQALPAFAVAQAIAARAMMPPAWPYEQGEPTACEGGASRPTAQLEELKPTREPSARAAKRPLGPTPFNR